MIDHYLRCSTMVCEIEKSIREFLFFMSSYLNEEWALTKANILENEKDFELSSFLMLENQFDSFEDQVRYSKLPLEYSSFLVICVQQFRTLLSTARENLLNASIDKNHWEDREERMDTENEKKQRQRELGKLLEGVRTNVMKETQKQFETVRTYIFGMFEFLKKNEKSRELHLFYTSHDPNDDKVFSYHGIRITSDFKFHKVSDISNSNIEEIRQDVFLNVYFGKPTVISGLEKIQKAPKNVYFILNDLPFIDMDGGKPMFQIEDPKAWFEEIRNLTFPESTVMPLASGSTSHSFSRSLPIEVLDDYKMLYRGAQLVLPYTQKFQAFSTFHNFQQSFLEDALDLYDGFQEWNRFLFEFQECVDVTSDKDGFYPLRFKALAPVLFHDLRKFSVVLASELRNRYDRETPNSFDLNEVKRMFFLQLLENNVKLISFSDFQNLDAAMRKLVSLNSSIYQAAPILESFPWWRTLMTTMIEWDQKEGRICDTMDDVKMYFEFAEFDQLADTFQVTLPDVFFQALRQIVLEDIPREFSKSGPYADKSNIAFWEIHSYLLCMSLLPFWKYHDSVYNYPDDSNMGIIAEKDIQEIKSQWFNRTIFNGSENDLKQLHLLRKEIREKINDLNSLDFTQLHMFTNEFRENQKQDKLGNWILQLLGIDVPESTLQACRTMSDRQDDLDIVFSLSMWPVFLHKLSEFKYNQLISVPTYNLRNRLSRVNLLACNIHDAVECRSIQRHSLLPAPENLMVRENVIEVGKLQVQAFLDEIVFANDVEKEQSLSNLSIDELYFWYYYLSWMLPSDKLVSFPNVELCLVVYSLDSESGAPSLPSGKSIKKGGREVISKLAQSVVENQHYRSPDLYLLALRKIVSRVFDDHKHYFMGDRNPTMALTIDMHRRNFEKYITSIELSAREFSNIQQNKNCLIRQEIDEDFVKGNDYYLSLPEAFEEYELQENVWMQTIVGERKDFILDCKHWAVNELRRQLHAAIASQTSSATEQLKNGGSSRRENKKMKKESQERLNQIKADNIRQDKNSEENQKMLNNAMTVVDFQANEQISKIMKAFFPVGAKSSLLSEKELTEVEFDETPFLPIQTLDLGTIRANNDVFDCIVASRFQKQIQNNVIGLFTERTNKIQRSNDSSNCLLDMPIENMLFDGNLETSQKLHPMTCFSTSIRSLINTITKDSRSVYELVSLCCQKDNIMHMITTLGVDPHYTDDPMEVFLYGIPNIENVSPDKQIEYIVTQFSSHLCSEYTQTLSKNPLLMDYINLLNTICTENETYGPNTDKDTLQTHVPAAISFILQAVSNFLDRRIVFVWNTGHPNFMDLVYVFEPFGTEFTENRFMNIASEFHMDGARSFDIDSNFIVTPTISEVQFYEEQSDDLYVRMELDLSGSLQMRWDTLNMNMDKMNTINRLMNIPTMIPTFTCAPEIASMLPWLQGILIFNRTPLRLTYQDVELAPGQYTYIHPISYHQANVVSIHDNISISSGCNVSVTKDGEKNVFIVEMFDEVLDIRLVDTDENLLELYKQIRPKYNGDILLDNVFVGQTPLYVPNENNTYTLAMYVTPFSNVVKEKTTAAVRSISVAQSQNSINPIALFQKPNNFTVKEFSEEEVWEVAGIQGSDEITFLEYYNHLEILERVQLLDKLFMDTNEMAISIHNISYPEQPIYFLSMEHMRKNEIFEIPSISYVPEENNSCNWMKEKFNNETLQQLFLFYNQQTPKTPFSLFVNQSLLIDNAINQN